MNQLIKQAIPRVTLFILFCFFLSPAVFFIDAIIHDKQVSADFFSSTFFLLGILLVIGAVFLTLDVWWRKGGRPFGLNYPPQVSKAAILSKTIFLNRITISLISMMILFALFGVYYWITGDTIRFSGTQMASILGGVTAGPILKSMPKIQDWLYQNITTHMRDNNNYTAIVGTSVLAQEFIENGVRVPPDPHKDRPISIVSEEDVYVLYAKEEEISQDLRLTCHDRFIGVISELKFKQHWVKGINFHNLERIFIGTGNDLTNIEYLGVFLKALDAFKEENPSWKEEKILPEDGIQITVEIEDRDLVPFLDEAYAEFADSQKDECGNHLDGSTKLQYVSYNELAADDYFSRAEPKYLDRLMAVSEEPAHRYEQYLNDMDSSRVILIGTGELAKEFIYFLCKAWHLPSKDGSRKHPTIILMGPADGEDSICMFEKEIKQLFPHIDEHFCIEAVPVDFFRDNIDSDEMYKKVWGESDLKRIFLVHDDSARNIELINILINRAYKDEMVLKCPPKNGVQEEREEREVFLANKEFSELHLAMTVESKVQNSKLHRVNSFGLMNELSLDQNIFNVTDEKLTDLLDEKINSSKDNESKDANVALARRRAAKSLSQHLDVKLIFLGLEKNASEKKIEELCLENKKVLFTRLANNSEELLEKLWEFEVGRLKQDDVYSLFFGDDARFGDFVRSIIECEHDRWLCYHQINNWKYKSDLETNDYEKKESPYLKPLGIMSTNSETDVLVGSALHEAVTVAFEQYLNIPSVLAKAGYSLRFADKSKVKI